MMKHENQNIEIINKDLWAVRFSLIPLIPQLSIIHKEGTDTLSKNDFKDLPCQFGPDGIMVLNKDFRWYDVVRETMLKVMGMSTWRIKKELSPAALRAADTPQKIIRQYCLEAEAERRKQRKERMA